MNNENNERNAREIGERIPKFRNVDNEDLLPWDKLPVANVWEVSGTGAQELEAFVPTRAELLEIARGWAQVAIYRQFVSLTNRSYSETDWRLICYAWRRIERIRNLIGDELVDVIIREKMNELHEGPRSREEDDWPQFLSHDDQGRQRDQFARLNPILLRDENSKTC